MNKQNILRTGLSALSWIALIYITIVFLLGKAGPVSTVLFIIYYGMWGINLLLKLILVIISYNLHKKIVEQFKILQEIHKTRHKLYFTDEAKKVEDYSEIFEKLANNLVNVCNQWLEDGIFIQKHSKHIEEMLVEINNMINTS